VDDDANLITKCDRDGNRIMMILPEGIVLTKSTDMDAMKGKGTTPPPRGSGRMFNRPTDIAVHPDTGELYVTDGYGNNVVHRLHPDGSHISTWGGPGAALGELNTPHCVIIHPDLKHVIVCDRQVHTRNLPSFIS